MCKLHNIPLSILILFSFFIFPNTIIAEKAPDYTAYYAVILEQNDFPHPYSPLAVDFLNSQKLEAFFQKAGIPEKNIYTRRNGVTQKGISNAFSWLNSRTSPSDTVFFYIFAHGFYIDEYLEWETGFTPLWLSIPAAKKILAVDACFGGRFIESITRTDADFGILIASCSSDELSWCGLEHEGLPVLGSSWLHFFLQAAEDHNSDTNKDGQISLQEAFLNGIGPLQDYMMNTVYSVPEFLKGIHQYGVFPELMEGYPNPVFISSGSGEIPLVRIDSEH